MPQVSRKRGRDYSQKNAVPYKRSRSSKYGRRDKTLAQKVSRLIQSQEKKWLDTAVGGALPPGTVACLNMVPQGDDSVSRDGRKINIRSLACHVMEPNYPHGTSMLRYVVVWDKQPNGALAAATDIMTSTAFTAQMNLNNRSRFSMIYDSSTAKKYGSDPVPNNAGQLCWGDQRYIPLDLETVFNAGTGAAITAINTGALLMVLLGVPNTSAQFDCIFRIRFVDS